jgi:S1-C subfamily serine protease
MSEDSFLVEPRRVTELKPGSAAAKAGLREGDEIVSWEGVTPRIAHSAPNVVLASRVQLRVGRDGREFSVDFPTAGPVVTEYHWTLRPDIRPFPGVCDR